MKHTDYSVFKNVKKHIYDHAFKESMPPFFDY